MAITNFGTLRAAVADFLHRSDLTAAIPTFIDFATARFSDELKTPEMEAIYTTTVADEEYIALPSDFRSVRLLMSENKPLEYLTPFELQEYARRTYRPPIPVYTIQDMQLRIYPLQTDLGVFLTYYAALPALVNDVDTNWLLTKRPDVYLHAAIAQARIYLHDDQRVLVAQQMTDKFIAEANRAAKRIAIGSSPLTITPA